MNTILIIIGVLVVGAGVVIYFIKAGKFINSIKIDFKKKQLDKLTNDPEYQKILKNTTSNLSTTTILNSDTKE